MHLPASSGLYFGPRCRHQLCEHLGNTSLHKAAGRQAEQVVRRLVDRAAAVNARNVDGNTPLRLAVKSKVYQSASLLLDRGANVRHNNNTANDNTPLFKSGVTRTVHALFENGAFLDLQNKDLETVLHDAVKYRRDELVSYLMTRAPELCTVPDKDGNLPVHFVRDRSILKLLIQSGDEQLQARNYHGTTPLLSVVSFQSKNSCSRLSDVVQTMALHNVTLIQLRDTFGNNALHIAAHSCYSNKNDEWCDPFSIPETLVLNGCDINNQNKFGQTPLHMRKYRESIINCLRLGARPDVEDKLGRNFFH